jgi:hypothetical protein
MGITSHAGAKGREGASQDVPAQLVLFLLLTLRPIIQLTQALR